MVQYKADKTKRKVRWKNYDLKVCVKRCVLNNSRLEMFKTKPSSLGRQFHAASPACRKHVCRNWCNAVDKHRLDRTPSSRFVWNRSITNPFEKTRHGFVYNIWTRADKSVRWSLGFCTAGRLYTALWWTVCDCVGHMPQLCRGIR